MIHCWRYLELIGMTSDRVLLVETFAAVTAAMLYQRDTQIPIR